MNTPRDKYQWSSYEVARARCSDYVQWPYHEFDNKCAIVCLTPDEDYSRRAYIVRNRNSNVVLAAPEWYPGQTWEQHEAEIKGSGKEV